MPTLKIRKQRRSIFGRLASMRPSRSPNSTGVPRSRLALITDTTVHTVNVNAGATPAVNLQDVSVSMGTSFRGFAREFPVEFRFDELGLVLKSNGTVVVRGVTGELKCVNRSCFKFAVEMLCCCVTVCLFCGLRHGRCTAIMGPSGAGKSSFLTALAGKASFARTTGNVYINGEQGQLSTIKSVVGYVPQEVCV